MTLTISRRPLTAVAAAVAAALSWMVVTPAASGTGSPAGAVRTAFVDPAVSAATGSVKVIVQGAASVESAIREMGGSVTHELPLIGGFSAVVNSTDVPRIAQLPGATSITLDRPAHVQSTSMTARALPRESVYTKATRGDSLTTAGYKGQGVTVALIDTGIDPLPDIAPAIKNVWADPLHLTTTPCVNLTSEPTCVDTFGHGTHMAGIIAGNGSASGGKYAGMATRAKIVSIKIAGASGASDVSTIISALQWVVTNKAEYGLRVVNLSLGTDSPQSYHVDPLNYAVEQAWFAGVVVNVAASNRGPAAGTISKPADDPFVITVGAVDDRGTAGYGDDSVPNFTGRGPTAADGLAKPDVVAPGTYVVSLAARNATLTNSIPTSLPAPYRAGSGTSQATAVVTGLVAQMLSADSSLTPDRVKYMLMSTAHQVASTDPMVVGQGLVDGPAALSAGQGLANQGVEPGLGTGSLAASRGTVGVVLDDANSTVLDGSTCLTFALTCLDTSGGNWFGGNWFGGNWFGGNWFGGNWFGGNWFGGNWFGGNWFGGNWFENSTNDDYGEPAPGSAWYGAWL